MARSRRGDRKPKLPKGKMSKKEQLLADEDLVKRIVIGKETELFGVLYDRYSNKVFHKCLSLSKNYDTSKDLTHDIMIKVYTSLHKLKYFGNFSLWVHTITYNHCMDHLRLKKKLRLEDFEESQFEGVSVDSIEAEHQELKEIRLSKLEKLFPVLSGEEKMILLMRYQDGMAVKQISDSLDLGESAVKMRLKRARDRLYEMLNET